MVGKTIFLGVIFDWKLSFVPLYYNEGVKNPQYVYFVIPNGKLTESSSYNFTDI